MIENLKFAALKQQARNTIERFPFLALLAVATFVFLLSSTVLSLRSQKDIFEECLYYVFYVSLYAVPITLAAERLSYPRLRTSLAAALLGTMTWFAHYLALWPPQFEWALTFASFSLCAVSPFLKDGNNDRLSYYWYRTLQAGFWTFVPCVILSIAVGCLQFSLKTLFDIRFNDFTSMFFYGGIWVLLAPLFFFGQLPLPAQIDAVNECTAPKPIKIILTWLLIPIALVFFFLLYAYFAKAAVMHENVRGTLVGLIIGYSIYGMVVLLFSYPLMAEDNKAARWLHKYFFAVILLPAVILLWRVWIRIAAYGLTVDRIFALVFAIWLLGTALVYVYRDMRTRQLRFIPLGVGLIALVLYAGPWNPQSVAINAQMHRLIATLKAENLYRDGRLVVDSTSKPHIQSVENQRIIISTFDYLRNMDRPWRSRNQKRIKPLDELFANTPLASSYDNYGPSYYTGSYGYRLLARIAVPIKDKDVANSRAPYLSIQFSNDYSSQQNGVYNVTGYNVVIMNFSPQKGERKTTSSTRSWFFDTTAETQNASTRRPPAYRLEAWTEGTDILLDIFSTTPGAPDRLADTLRLDIGKPILDRLAVKAMMPSSSVIYVTGEGKLFKASLRLSHWSGDADYASDSKEESPKTFKTNNVTGTLMLRRR